MPSGFELTQAHYSALDDNDAAVKTMGQLGEDAAKKEAAYNVVLGKAMLALETDGCKATLCEKYAKARPDVSTAFVAFKCAEVQYATSKEHVQLTKRRADAIRDQLAREWTQAGGRA